jgi:hypothetical protein
MVKIITALEARVIQSVLESNVEILRGEGYEYEANETLEAMRILNGLVEKDAEEVIK